MHTLQTAPQEFQIRGVFRIIQTYFENKSKIFFSLFLNENISCDPSLEPSRRDGSNDGSQNMFLGRNGKLSLNYHGYSFLSGPLWSSGAVLH